MFNCLPREDPGAHNLSWNLRTRNQQCSSFLLRFPNSINLFKFKHRRQCFEMSLSIKASRENKVRLIAYVIIMIKLANAGFCEAGEKPIKSNGRDLDCRRLKGRSDSCPGTLISLCIPGARQKQYFLLSIHHGSSKPPRSSDTTRPCEIMGKSAKRSTLIADCIIYFLVGDAFPRKILTDRRDE